MSKKHALSVDNKSLKKVVLFSGIVLILIILSLLIRFFYIIKISKFDGRHRFNLAVIESDTKATILSTNPKDKSISQMNLIGKRDKLSPGKILGIPVDGTVGVPYGETVEKDKASDILFSIITNKKIMTKQITSLDIIRMYIFVRTVQAGNIITDTVSTHENKILIDKVASRLFADQAIINEQKSIEIVNGTGIDGLGKRLERIIKNSGGNVIAVSNTHDIKHSSNIYFYLESSYTQQRLKRILNYPGIRMQNREIADIRIVIGMDGVREEVF